ncbi:MAG TPA: hypothetical protein VKU88_06590 [Acidimicrobiales bacterium]|nr:hypothetical protein [Acidimicrobiales bacterium]
MNVGHKLVLVAALVLLAAGVGRATTGGGGHARVGSRGSPRRDAASTASVPAPPAPTTGASQPGTSAASGPAPPTSGALREALINPTDMGGYYRVDPSAAETILDSSACLAPFQPAPAQAGRAVTGLLGPDRFSLPTIVEVLGSYRGAAAYSVYESVSAALASCAALGFDFGGRTVSAALTPLALAPVGQADGAWSGTFAYSGTSLQVQLGAALDGQTVVGVVFITTVPPLDPIMGDFPSTLSLALGKLA